MDQVFVANPKGGCGKTTISIQLAGYYANNDRKVLLVDHDAQRSSSDWLASRPYQCAKIQSKASKVDDPVEFGDAEVVVHDMPAAWSLEHVSELIHAQDKVIIPVLASPNDIKACIRFLMSLNRSGVLENGVSVGIVSNRMRSNTNYSKVLLEFLERVELPLVGQLRDTQNYVKTMDKGLSLFDFPESRAKQDREQWQPILRWLHCGAQ